MENLRAFGNENKISALYFLGIVLFIFLSNFALSAFVKDLALLNTLKNVNSGILALISTGIIYLIIKAKDQREEAEETVTFSTPQQDSPTPNFADILQEKVIPLVRKAPSPMAILKGENHTYDFVNDAYLDMLGHKKLVGKTVKQAFPEVKEQGLIEKLDSVYHSGKPAFGKQKPLMINQNGTKITYFRDYIYYPLTDAEGKVFGIFIQCNDVTKQIEAEQQLEKKVDERQLLMGELHHRVKNNLTVIAGLLELQADNFKDREKKMALKSTQTRIYTIADIHEALYHKKSLNEIPLNDFMLDIPQRTFDFFDEDTPSVKVFANKESININQAVPLGLLLNEFFSFLAQDHSDKIHELTVLADCSQAPSMTIKIKINSFSPELIRSFNSSEGFRNNLVALLLEQLGARLETSFSKKSSEMNLHFQKQDKDGPYGNYFEEPNTKKVAHA